jgi:PhnB protein
MAGNVPYKPEGYNTVHPYLIVSDASELVDFLKKVFNAEEKYRMPKPNGRIMHAEVRIGDSIIMLSEHDSGEQPFPAMLHLYIKDPAEAYQRAVDAGATSLREPKEEFYGDLTAGVKDRFGNQWWMAAHVRDVSPEEMEQRMAQQAR